MLSLISIELVKGHSHRLSRVTAAVPTSYYLVAQTYATGRCDHSAAGIDSLPKWTSAVKLIQLIQRTSLQVAVATFEPKSAAFVESIRPPDCIGSYSYESVRNQTDVFSSIRRKCTFRQAQPIRPVALDECVMVNRRMRLKQELRRR